MPSILANGETLNYIGEGNGPVVVLVHSLGANSYMWRPIMDKLKDRFCCIAVDCRGHGKSSYKNPFTVRDVAADLNAVLDELEIKRAHIVGISMGGPIVLEMYAERPGRIASLVIADSFYDNRASSKERLAETEQQMQGKTMRTFGEEYAKSRLMPSTPQRAYDELAEAVSMVAPKTFLDTLTAISTVGFQGLIAAVSVPTLICYGDNERLPLQRQGRQMHEMIAGSELAVIDNAGHLSAIDQPDAFAKLIGDFIGRVE
ncbi:MAG: catD 2 [Rhodospirillales bacterium]|jgi:pimeloyl-ACP methyl ester carboxylesterase|nr:catD 2 [Rhodospirillales bacterium]